MKKFLFTLAALMMAGSAFAANYFYIDDFNVTEDMLGQDVEVAVAGHFTEFVSANQFKINLPEGFEVVEYWEGEDATIEYYTNTGRLRTVTAGFTSNDNVNFIVITSATTQGYYQVDGAWVSYGAIKWEPGDYDELLVLVVHIPADFDYTQKNVAISIDNECSSGQDPRGPIADNTPYTANNVINPYDAPVTTDFVGTADVTFNGNVATISYTSNDPNATVEVTLNGQPLNVTFENGVATWEAPQNTAVGEYSYTVAIKVTPDGVNYVGEPVQDSDTYSYTIQPTAFVGTADVTFNENVATLTYTSNDPNADVVVTVNGEEVEVEWNNGVATWTAPVSTAVGEYRYEVTLTVTPDGVNYVGEPVSDTDVFSYTILETTATPTITIVDQNAHHCYFTVEGDGVVTVLVDGEPAETIVIDGVTYYVVYADTDGPVDYVITATAKEEGKYESAPATENVHFDQWDSVNELVNGKTVAGVRYYNMAGQEMQQANGMTIVVTTYTDGTTSAVKVMK